MSSTFSVTSFLEKCANRDSDYRDMAGRDLAKELEKDSFKLDANQEKKVVEAVMLLVKDTNNMVQEQAIKCIGPLCKRIADRILLERMVMSLLDDLLDPKNDDNRDTAIIALRAIVTEIPPGSPVIKEVLIDKEAIRIMKAISSIESQQVKIAGLEILSELIRRFGRIMNTMHKPLLDTCLQQMAASSAATQKRAIACLSHLVVVVPENLFTTFMSSFVDIVEKATRTDHVRTYIQCLGVLSQSVGHRLGRFLNRIVPVIAKHCSAKSAQQEIDMRENCFSAFTSLAIFCPKEITPFLTTILELCLSFVKYDPLFGGDDESEPMDEDTAEPMDEDGQEEEEDAGDFEDEDMVYKIRKGAVKTLGAIFTSHPEVLPGIAQKAGKMLVSRFIEPVEDVKLDVLNTCISLLKAKTMLNDASAQKAVSDQFATLIPSIVAGIAKLLKHKSAKVKAASFALLKQLCSSMPGSLAANVSDVVDAVTRSLGDVGSSSTLKIEALSFLRMLITSHPPLIFQPLVPSLAPHLFKAIGDPVNRIAEEAIHLSCSFIYVIRQPGSPFDFKPYVEPMYTAVNKQAQNPSSDQEVKEASAECLGTMIAVLGDVLPKQADCLKLLISKLSGEVARTATVKVLPLIVKSPLQIDLSPYLADIMNGLNSFLKKQDRDLQESSLLALCDVLSVYGNAKNANNLTPTTVAELATLISFKASDLYIVQLSLRVATTLLHTQGAAVVQAIQEKLLSHTIKLIESSLVQGMALEALLTFFGELVVVNAKQLGYQQLLDALLGIKSAETSKPVLFLVAQCVGAISAKNSNPKQVFQVVDNFIANLKSKDEPLRQKSLLCVGEIGRRQNLDVHAEILQNIYALFTATVDTRYAAAVALGNVTLGNMEKFLPFLLDQIASASAQIQRLLLVSLREVIRSRVENMSPHVESIMKILFKHCDSDDVATRDTVAEVLGKLAPVSPSTIVSEVASSLTSRSSYKRGTMVAALKFALSEGSAAVDAAIAPHVAAIMDLLTYPHDDKMKRLNVRERAILTVKYLCAQKPALVREIVPKYISALLSEGVPKQEYIKIVEMGLGKITIDDAVQARKDTFETLALIAKNITDKVDFPSLLRGIVPGLTDVYDIRISCYQLIAHAAAAAPNALLEASDVLIGHIVGTVKLENKRAEELERDEEVRSAALNALAVIAKCPNADSFPKLQEILSPLMNDKDLGEKIKKLIGNQ